MSDQVGNQNAGFLMTWLNYDWSTIATGQVDLNLNSLLVKRQIDNPSPGAVTGGN